MLTFYNIEKFKKQWRLTRHFTHDLTLVLITGKVPNCIELSKPCAEAQ